MISIILSSLYFVAIATPINYNSGPYSCPLYYNVEIKPNPLFENGSTEDYDTIR